MSSTPEDAGEVRENRRETVLAEEKKQFGGMKFGSAFFGWLTATGMVVLLTAVSTAIGAGIGMATSTDPGQAASRDPQTVSIIGGIVLAVVLFVAYYCGGYVAGRMARFDGAKQGIAVWLWAIIVAIIVAIAGAIAGSRFNILANLNSFPRIPLNENELSTGGILVLVAAVIITLGGAVLGGLAGMRFHRKVDKAGLNNR
ncbi:hypothetical protein VUN84_07365 [Micrococcaceae bacterium Sec5.8]